jgi:hypothetical protein
MQGQVRADLERLALFDPIRFQLREPRDVEVTRMKTTNLSKPAVFEANSGDIKQWGYDGARGTINFFLPV